MMRTFHPVAVGPAPMAAPLEVTPPAVTVLETRLWATAPNPVSGSSSVRFSLKNPAEVTLDLFNVSGERVSRVASGWFAAGEHSVPWTRSTDSGQRLGAGIYFLQFQGDGVRHSQKVVLTP